MRRDSSLHAFRMSSRRPVVVILSSLIVGGPALGDAPRAQTLRSPNSRIYAGTSVGSGVALYEGRIAQQGLVRTSEGERLGRYETAYREHLDSYSELWGGVAFGLTDALFVGLRGRVGSAESTAEYRGSGFGMESFPRSVAWLGGDVVAGVGFGGDRISGTIVLGPSVTWYDISTGGMGRHELLEIAASPYRAVSVPDSIAWSDLSTRNVGWVLGAEGRLRVIGGLGLSVGLEQRAVRTGGDQLAETLSADLRNVTGEDPFVELESSSAWATVVRVGVEFRLPAREPSDPAPAAIGAVTGAHRRAGPRAAPLRGHAGVRRALVRGDTAAAVGLLRAIVESGGGSAAVRGRLGVLLATRVTDVSGDAEVRSEARALLDRALEEDPGHPRYLLAYAMLLEKQGLPLDAHRVRERGLRAAADRPEEIEREELAETFRSRARSLERHVLAFEHLRFVPDARLDLDAPECEAYGALGLNWARPGVFRRWFEPAPDLSSLVDTARAEMIREYSRALDVIPAHDGANRGILAAFARRGDWRRYLDRATAWTAADPADPWAGVFLALGRARLGHVDEAIEAFQRAIPELAPPARSAFAGAIPSPRTGVEPWSRLALAELLYGRPGEGRRGWELSRGSALVRLGVPTRRWQIRRDPAFLVLDEPEAEVAEMRRCVERRAGGGESASKLMILAGECQVRPGAAVGPGRDVGRWIFWSYGSEMPALVFDKDRRGAALQFLPEWAHDVVPDGVPVEPTADRGRGRR